MGVRLETASAVVRDLAPAGLQPTYVAVTALGETTVLLFGLSLLYWLGWRRETAAVVSYGFAGFGTVLALKAWFALPRPPAADALIAVGGYGFPSGHAIAAVVVYGGLALERGWHAEPPKAAGTVALVGAVGLSRVVLGVHYLGDVLVGFLAGAAVLAAAHRAAREDLAYGYGLGVAAAVVAVVLTGGGVRALGVLGACVGGALGARFVDPAAALGSWAERAVLVVVGLAFLLVVEAGAALLAGVALAAWLDDLVLVAGVLSLPALLARSGVTETTARLVGS
jgi:membrane-associated phospholipid phosphatase